MYYKNSIEQIRNIINFWAPHTDAVEAKLKPKETAPLSHLLWMCDQIQKMDTLSIKSAVKAARWIGWVFAHLELWGYLDNTAARNLSRKDNEEDFDIPLGLNGIELTKV